MLLLGNHSDNRLKIGCINANYGCLLTGDGKGHFNYMPQPRSGLSIKGDVKSAIELKTSNGRYIIAGICNEGRNVFGMMPHPERACSPLLGNTDGRKVFEMLFSLVLETA